MNKSLYKDIATLRTDARHDDEYQRIVNTIKTRRQSRRVERLDAILERKLGKLNADTSCGHDSNDNNWDAPATPALVRG